ncbi:hypothetical protein HO173_005831 [Letharia columbiana]|uniref:Uncharacterized protein n=1 Tax=Letharia columbiana TaxID=112416 RepID=A0A8H6FWX5_9LECA|nr:uncharacterized protein HO173_005831 [Letharia columbiana]KAF6236202.1 hypothetical protein HO173_005831 [Letharia columbiana]
MEKPERLPFRGKSVKDPGKGVDHRKKKERHSAKVEEDEFQEELEEETELFRACDDKTIEMNRLRKFSKNFKFDRPRSEDLSPVLARDGTRQLEATSKASGENGQKNEQREPKGS